MGRMTSALLVRLSPSIPSTCPGNPVEVVGVASRDLDQQIGVPQSRVSAYYIGPFTSVGSIVRHKLRSKKIAPAILGGSRGRSVKHDTRE